MTSELFEYRQAPQEQLDRIGQMGFGPEDMRLMYASGYHGWFNDQDLTISEVEEIVKLGKDSEELSKHEKQGRERTGRVFDLLFDSWGVYDQVDHQLNTMYAKGRVNPSTIGQLYEITREVPETRHLLLLYRYPSIAYHLLYVQPPEVTPPTLQDLDQCSKYMSKFKIAKLDGNHMRAMLNSFMLRSKNETEHRTMLERLGYRETVISDQLKLRETTSSLSFDQQAEINLLLLTLLERVEWYK